MRLLCNDNNINYKLLDLLDIYINNQRAYHISLELYECKITKIPDTIGKLIYLQTLYLCHNNLATIPDTIGNLINLTILDVNNNKLSVLPNSIGNLINLKFLYLSYNKLKYLPNSIIKLINLHVLYINNNKLVKISFDIIKLNKMYISINKKTYDKNYYFKNKIIIINNVNNYKIKKPYNCNSIYSL
jgi:Leucine-rich repeat (LRR) protein